MHANHSFDRRAFLKLAGTAGLAAGLPLVSPAIGLARLDRKLMVAQQTRMLMGTLVAVTVVDPSADRAQEALEKTFLGMAQAARLFDRHGGDGPVAQLNREGFINDIPPQLWQVLNLCRSVHHLSGGAFDITVAPIVDTFRRCYLKTGRPADAKEISRALAAVGALRWEKNALRLTRPDAAITLDGVAKGYIIDRGLETAAAAGAKRVLINAGGDVAVLGTPSPGRNWRVGVADPHHPDRPKLIVKMDRGALATSGNYEIYFDRERLFNHIVNPATGLSPRTDDSASVRAPSAAVADALSTACFVMQPEDAMRFVGRQPGVEALIFTRLGQRYQSKGFMS